MHLSVSNLAIPADASLEGLRAKGVTGLEVAPTRIAPWEAQTAAAARAYRTRVEDAGLQVSSLQALLFATDGLHLLRDEQAFAAMKEHLRHVARVGAALGAGIGVFGSPKNRLKGDLADDDAWKLGRDRLAQLANTVGAEGFALGLEPVPPAYGGDFLTRTGEVIRMVEDVDHPALRVHLDTGCALLGGDDIAAAVRAAGSRLGHFHIAEPKLTTFGAPQAEHRAAAEALREIGYQRWTAIEMLEPPADPMHEVDVAVAFANATYG